MGFKGFSFLLFSERIGGYKKVNLGFIWNILETLEKRRAGGQGVLLSFLVYSSFISMFLFTMVMSSFSMN